MLKHAVLMVSAIVLMGQTTLKPRYAEGQIWEYQARAKDGGSLLKIQKVEGDGPARIYHVSVIGVHFGPSSVTQSIQHLPVSAETLDASVTRPAQADADFPQLDFEDGIAEWRRAKGGVFTIPVREIVEIIDAQVGDLSTS